MENQYLVFVFIGLFIVYLVPHYFHQDISPGNQVKSSGYVKATVRSCIISKFGKFKHLIFFTRMIKQNQLQSNLLNSERQAPKTKCKQM